MQKEQWREAGQATAEDQTGCAASPNRDSSVPTLSLEKKISTIKLFFENNQFHTNYYNIQLWMTMAEDLMKELASNKTILKRASFVNNYVTAAWEEVEKGISAWLKFLSSDFSCYGYRSDLQRYGGKEYIYKICYGVVSSSVFGNFQ